MNDSVLSNFEFTKKGSKMCLDVVIKIIPFVLAFEFTNS